MSDISDLVARLRNTRRLLCTAANTFEAQAARIAELEAQIARALLHPDDLALYLETKAAVEASNSPPQPPRQVE